jgi:Cu(I)/Ag(I) efflux system membrane fusion protein
MKKPHAIWAAISILMLAALAGVLTLRQPENHQPSGPAIRNGVTQDHSGQEVLYWYDPMVPEQKFDKPGKSPFMDMQLVPKYAGAGGDAPTVSVPSQTLQNLGIRMEPVTRTSFESGLTAVGRIEPNERAYYAVQTRVPGFVDRLYIRAVGDPVAKGQKVAEIYAPDLLAAQKEYLALLDLDQVEGAADLQEASRGRLKLLGMTESEIRRVAESRQAAPRIGVYAPASGIVTELGAREGAQLMAGSTLLQISDLSRVWLIAEIPERDAGQVRPGMPAKVELQSLPGESVSGKVGYLYPALDPATRTLRARIELPNPKGVLRPGMYANVSLGGQSRDVLTVPTESVIATGKRKVVILKESNGFRPAEIQTGQESLGRTEILSGVSEGEQVVVSGQFLIDSEASLSGALARLSQQPAGEVSSVAPLKMPRGTGKVVAIDAAAKEITLAHDPIPEIGWPAMTMGFKVNDAAHLQHLQVGDAVAFDLKSSSPDGEYAIERIEKTGTAAGTKP